MFFVILAAVLAGADLLIKYGIDNIPDDEFPKTLNGTGGKVEIQKLHNPGFPFGFLKHFPKLVQGVPLVITSCVLGALSYLLPKKGHNAEKLGLSVILGGALSNLFDRFFREYVVDYIHIKKKPLDKAVFNLGDFFIVTGALIVSVVSLISELRDFFSSSKKA